MSRRTYSGLEIAKVLQRHGFVPVPGGRGSHRKFVYEDSNTGEVRTVIVPMHDELRTGTLREIAGQAGANDFQRFLDWLENTL